MPAFYATIEVTSVMRVEQRKEVKILSTSIQFNSNQFIPTPSACITTIFIICNTAIVGSHINYFRSEKLRKRKKENQKSS